MKRLFSALLCVALLCNSLAIPAVAARQKVITAESNITKEDLISQWKAIQPPYRGDPFIARPKITAPYGAGVLTPEYLKTGLDMANFARYTAHLPADLTLDETLNNQAQHGAVLLAGTQKLTHTPEKPADMDNDFYQMGYESTTTSNINMGYTNLDTAVLGFMSDADRGNISRVGHRRWILNPQLQKIGFGVAQSSDRDIPYGTMQVFDQSRSQKMDYDFISWPAYGYHPAELLKDKDPWSVTLNPEKFDNTRTSEIRVTISSGSTIKHVMAPNNTNVVGDYFNVDTGNTGAPFCIIFRPMASFSPGVEYFVDINGIYEKGGDAPIRIQYTTEFVKMDNTVHKDPYQVPSYVSNCSHSKFRFDNDLIQPYPAEIAGTQMPYDIEKLRGKNVLIFSWRPFLNNKDIFEFLLDRLSENVHVVFVNMWFANDISKERLKDYIGNERYLRLQKYSNWTELCASGSTTEPAFDGVNTMARYLGKMHMGTGCGATGAYVSLNSDLKYGCNATSEHMHTETAYQTIMKDAFDIPVTQYPSYTVDASGFEQPKINAYFREETSFTYDIDDTSIAKISSDGTITGLKKGETKVHVGANGAKGKFTITINVNPPKYSDLIVSGTNVKLLPSEQLAISCKIFPGGNAIVPDKVTFNAPYVKYDPATQKISSTEQKYGRVIGTAAYGNVTKEFTIDYSAPQPNSDPLYAKFKDTDSDAATKTEDFSLTFPSPASVKAASKSTDKWKITDSSTTQTPQGIALSSIKGDGASMIFSFKINKNCRTSSITLSNQESNLAYKVPVGVEIAKQNAPEKPKVQPKPIEGTKPDGSLKPNVTPKPSGNYLAGASSWAQAELKSATEQGLMFDAILNNYQKNITRAEFCKLVMNFYRSLGGDMPAVSQSPFNDTTDSDILIANKLGIVNGKTSTTFDPNADITREQISAMMMRAIKKFHTPSVHNDLTKFADYYKISAYAVESLAFLNQEGIIKGMSATEIAPLANTTREQAGIIVYRTFNSFEADQGNQTGQAFESGIYKIVTATNPENCISVVSGRHDDGAHTIAWTNMPVDDQKFIIERNGTKYSIKALHSRKALTPDGAQANGTAIVQKGVNSNAEQYYDIIDAGNGYFNIVASGGLYVSVSAGSPDKGTPIILWEKTGHASQQFKFEKAY